MDLFSLNAFTVFLAIGAVGFVFLMVSLVFGEIFEHSTAASTTISIRRARVLQHAGHERVRHGLRRLRRDRDALRARHGRRRRRVGFVGGVALAAPVYFFARFLFGQQASSDIGNRDFVGQVGRVVVAIPAGGVGQVRCRIGEELVDKIARAREPGPIAENETVVVEEVSAKRSSSRSAEGAANVRSSVVRDLALPVVAGGDDRRRSSPASG